MSSQVIRSFFYDAAREINRARCDHLVSLGLPFTGKHVLETGCGGCGDITQTLLSLGAAVTLNDYREENIRHLLSEKRLSLPYNLWDLNKPITDTQVFDIIVSYGTLYHLSDPATAIKSFSEKCRDFTIISTCTDGTNGASINLLFEGGGNEQSHNGYGCRPGRGFIHAELKKHFPYVYFVRTQPNYSDFPLHFPTSNSSAPNRNIFIGSHIPLNNALFTEEFINDFAY